MIQRGKKLTEILHITFLSAPPTWYSAPMNSMTRKEFLEQVQSLCELMSYEELVDLIYLNQMFQRFSAFRREVNGIMEHSSLLSGL